MPLSAAELLLRFVGRFYFLELGGGGGSWCHELSLHILLGSGLAIVLCGSVVPALVSSLVGLRKPQLAAMQAKGQAGHSIQHPSAVSVKVI